MSVCMHTYAITGGGIKLRCSLAWIVWRGSLSRMDALQAKAEPKEGGIASARGGLPARGESCSACTGQNKEIAQEGVLHSGKVLCLNLTSGLHVSCSEESLALLQQSFTEMFLGVCTSNGHDMHLKSNACHVHGMFLLCRHRHGAQRRRISSWSERPQKAPAWQQSGFAHQHPVSARTGRRQSRQPPLASALCAPPSVSSERCPRPAVPPLECLGALPTSLQPALRQRLSARQGNAQNGARRAQCPVFSQHLLPGQGHAQNGARGRKIRLLRALRGWRPMSAAARARQAAACPTWGQL
jgi:hypothetical protein